MFHQHQQVAQPLFSQSIAQPAPMFPQPTGTVAMSPVPMYSPSPSTMPTAPVPMYPPPTSTMAMASMVQHPVVQPTHANPPVFQSNLTMPPIGPAPSYTSPYTPEPAKRKATEPATDSPSPKRHSGFNISPAVQDTLRRELPLKEWMKPKEVARVGPGTSSEPITIDEDATTGGNSGAEVENDMVSLFGDDNEDEFEADLCAALDEEMRKDAMESI